MRCLVVIAHPKTKSLCHTLATKAIDGLLAAGHEVLIEDLYRNEFATALSVTAKTGHSREGHGSILVQPEIANLLSAEGLVLCFPTWWFGFPATLKGWFDQTWEPGVAYDHANGLGSKRPRLHNLRKVLAVTSLGSPWWIDRLVMHQPVKRVLKTAILGTCAPACHFEMLSIYKSQSLDDAKVQRFVTRIDKSLAKWS